jgi:hypothetical protein
MRFIRGAPSVFRQDYEANFVPEMLQRDNQRKTNGKILAVTEAAGSR